MGDIFGISGIAGAMIAQGTAEESQQRAEAATAAALAQIQNVGAGPDLARQITLQAYQQAGILTPQTEQAINVHFQQIQAPDKNIQSAQQAALQGMLKASQGGMTAEDRVLQNQIRDKKAREDQAARNSITQEMQRRGLSGGGAELATRLQANQGSMNEASESSDRMAANAQMRSLQALASLGNLSGQQAQQQFNQNAANANVVNEQNRFNVANQLGQQQRNVGNANQAQQYNLQTAQSILNANTGQANQEALRQVQAQQQMYANKMAQAQAAANARIGQGTQIANFGQQNAAAYAGMAGGIGNVAQGVYDKYGNSSSNEPKGYGPTASGSSTGLGSEGSYKGEDDSFFWQGGRVNMAEGGEVKGPEIVPGSSPKNDVIPARLSSGEYVVPKEDAPSMELIHQILKGLKKK